MHELISRINDGRQTRDHGEKSQKQLSSLPVMADWGQFEIKILIVRHINTTYFMN